jgi:dipeptidyl aminopeptidase/acylaminoacyl peptidase
MVKLALQFAVCAAVTWLSALSASAAVPIETFAQDPTAHALALSPDGKYVAAVQRTGKTENVVVYNLAAAGAKPIAIGLEGVKFGWLDWANDNRLLICLVIEDYKLKRVRGEFTVGRVVAVDADGSNRVTLFTNSGTFKSNAFLTSVTHQLPDDPKHVLMPAYGGGGKYNLYKVDIYTGVADVVAEGERNTVSWSADVSGTPRIRRDYIDRRDLFAVMARKGDTDQWEKIADIPVETKLASSARDFEIEAFTDKPGIVYAKTRAGSDRVGLYEYDLSAKSVGRAVFTHPKVDIGALLMDSDGRAIGAIYVDDRTRVQFFDAALKQIQADLAATFPDAAAVYPISYSRDRNKVIAYTEGPRDPGTYHLYDRAGGSIGEYARKMPQLPPGSLGDTKVIQYTSSDMTITGYVTYPPGKPGKGLPLVVLPHGGPEARDQLQFDNMAQAISTRGYAVFQPNFRGSGGFGKGFATRGHGQWGLKMQEDVTEGVKKLIADGVVDPARVCIVGASYGGYAALAGGAFTPDLYKCVISIAGVSDLPMMMAEEKSHWGTDSEAYKYWRKLVGDPNDDKDRLEATSPAFHAANFKAPVLLIHGQSDDIVRITHSRRMRQVLQEAKKEVKYVEIAGEGHSFQEEDGSYAKLLKEIEAFLALHLGPAS